MKRQQPQQGIPPRPHERPMTGQAPYYPAYYNYPYYMCYPYYYQPGYGMYPAGTGQYPSQPPSQPTYPSGRPRPGYTPERPSSGTR